MDRKKPVHIHFTAHLTTSVISKIDAIAKKNQWHRSEALRQAVLDFIARDGKSVSSELIYAQAIYETLVREIKSGSVVYLENSKTQERTRLLIPIMKAK